MYQSSLQLRVTSLSEAIIIITTSSHVTKKKKILGFGSVAVLFPKLLLTVMLPGEESDPNAEVLHWVEAATW